MNDYLFRHLSEEGTETTAGRQAHLATLALPLIEQIPGSIAQTVIASVAGKS